MDDQNVGMIVASHCPTVIYDEGGGYTPACSECGPLVVGEFSNIWTEVYAPHLESKINEFLGTPSN